MEQRAKRQLTGWNSEDGLWQPGVCLWVRCWWAPDRIVALCDMGRTYHLADEVEIQRLLEMQMLLYVGEGDSREVDEVAGWLPDSTQWLSGMTLYRQRRGLTHQTCCHLSKAATNQYLPVWTSRTLFSKCLKLNPCEALPPLSWRTCQDSIKAHELGTDIFEHCGDYDYFHGTFLKKCQEKFQVSYAELGSTGSSISFLKNSWNSCWKIVEAYEEAFGATCAQMVPCDSAIQLEDLSQPLKPADASSYRSVVGMALYLGRDRPDAIVAIKELAGKMNRHTLTSLQHLKKLVGYLKHTGNVGVKLTYSMPGQGKYKTSAEKTWILETYSDADWAGNRVHRKSTPCGIHFLNGSFLYGNARTQKVVSLSSCESELHSIVSSRSDAIFLRRCLDFLLETAVLQVHYTDSSSARQLVSRQGCGKIRHLPGKVLRVQGKVHDGEVQMVQVRHFQNVVCLRWCAKLEWFKLKPWSLWENQKVQSWLNVQQLPETWASRAKTVMRMTMLMGLGPLGRRSLAMRLNSIEPVITSGLHSFSLHTFFHGWFLVQLRFGFGGSWTEGCITTSCNRPGSATGKPQWYPKARAQGRQWPACSSRPVLHRGWRDGGHGEYSSLWTGGGRGLRQAQTPRDNKEPQCWCKKKPTLWSSTWDSRHQTTPTLHQGDPMMLLCHQQQPVQ